MTFMTAGSDFSGMSARSWSFDFTPPRNLGRAPMRRRAALVLSASQLHSERDGTKTAPTEEGFDNRTGES